MENKYIYAERDFFYDRDIDIKRVGKHTMRKHCHNHFEIYFITKGACCYFIENKIFHLQPGDIILIPEGIMHNTEYQNTTYSRKLISCSRYFIPGSVEAKLSELIYLYRNPDVVEEINGIFDKIELEYANRDEFSEDVFKCYTNMLFFILARNPNLCIRQEDEKHYIDDAIDFMQSNFASEINLHDMAAKYFVSPEHFSRVFKRKVGFNFSEYINLLRLQKAESMLRQMNAASITSVVLRNSSNGPESFFKIKYKQIARNKDTKIAVNA